MKSFFWGFLVITCCVSAKAAWKTSTCRDADFAQSAWRDITAIEPRVQQHLDFIAKESGDVTGSTVNLTNCHVQLPVDGQGKTVDGDRVVTMDKVWEKYVNGRYEKQIAGMRIVFSEKIRVRIPKKSGYSRQKAITSSRSCTWNPSDAACKGFPSVPAIPVTLWKSPMPVPWALGAVPPLLSCPSINPVRSFASRRGPHWLSAQFPCVHVVAVHYYIQDSWCGV